MTSRVAGDRGTCGHRVPHRAVGEAAPLDKKGPRVNAYRMNPNWRDAQANVYRIGELAASYGVCAQTLRNWEREGILPPPGRTPGGHRRYTDLHVAAIAQIIPPIRQPQPIGDQDPWLLTRPC